MILDIFALVVLLVLVASAIGIAVVLGGLPGKIARDRGHPQAEAITVLGWLGLVTLGLAWPVALTWAYTRAEQTRDLEARVAALEGQRDAAGTPSGGDVT